jgi:hypothetical protein
MNLPRSLPAKAGLATVVSLAVHGFMVFSAWYAVSTIGYGGLFLLMVSLFLAMPLVVAVLAVPVVLVLLIPKSTCRMAMSALVCGLVYAMIGISLIQFTYPVRMAGFRRLAERSQPLVEAVHRYEEQEGRLPADLNALVSAYLPEVPWTGMPAYPEYKLETDPGVYHGNPWVLRVFTPRGFFNFDQFLYYPMQNYPEYAHGGWLEKIGRWAYVHE